jgi:hypothetical protein
MTFVVLNSREIQTLQQENYSLEKQVHSIQLGAPGPGGAVPPGGSALPPNQAHPNGARNANMNNKLFDNPSASSTASSGVGTSISSLNATSSSLNSNASAASGANPSNVLKKYMEQKYGNQPPPNQQQQQQNPNQNTNTSSSPSSSLFNSFLNTEKNPLGSGFFSQLTGNPNNNNNSQNPNNPNMNNSNDSPLGAGLSSLSSKFTSGFASFKLATSDLKSNNLTSKLLNPFSSN